MAVDSLNKSLTHPPGIGIHRMTFLNDETRCKYYIKIVCLFDSRPLCLFCLLFFLLSFLFDTFDIAIDDEY